MIGELKVPLELLKEARVGDVVTLVVVGVVGVIDGDLVDVSGYSGGLEYLTGQPTATIVVTKVHTQ